MPDAAISTRTPAVPDPDGKVAFLRMVSHELRTPLNSIIGFSELIRCELYGPLGAPQYQEYAGIIHDSGHRLLRLVNQILEVVRLLDGAAELSPSVQDLGPAITEALETLAEDAGRVSLDRSAGWPAVLADPRGLRAVLAALLHNAVAFSDGAAVKVRARRRGVQVEIEIEDRGGGIPLEDIPRLLRPFEQGENALTRRADGAGLGLTIARLTCEAMDGTLRLDSRPGAGLTAVVTLPAAIAGGLRRA